MDSLEACRQYYRYRCGCASCHYCGRRLGWHEHDHFPLPKRVGGKATVPACADCHALKDRISLGEWPSEAWAPAMAELVKLLPADQRAALDADPAWMPPAWSYEKVLKSWTSLAPLTRVLIAKMLAVDEDGRYLRDRGVT